jgi:hypothetical protein
MKICRTCKIEKDISNFSIRSRNKKTNKIYYFTDCKECTAINKKIYYQNNKLSFGLKNKEYYKLHKEDIINYKKNYRENNKEKVNIIQRKSESKKRKNNSFFRLRKDISDIIRKVLDNNGGSKKGNSIFDYLPYTMKDLIQHIESLFSHTDNLTSIEKIWMTWKNRGSYNKKIWNDNDPSTWMWQLDHIIPQSDLPYTSMEDENFQKCWALSNLRPLSAKQNLLDGVRKIRHKTGD